MAFINRKEAGQLLAKVLYRYANQENTILFALPRGGVPVAYEVAKSLNLPLDVFIVRKLGVPWNPELAMGAIASGGAKVLNPDIVQGLGVSKEEINQIIEREKYELERREQKYRQGRKLADLNNQTVLIVDDGIATGATMRAAIQAVKQLGCKQVIVAVPVAARSTVKEIKKEVDAIYCIETPEPLYAIGYWYQDFSQTTDEEVQAILEKTRGPNHESQK